MSSRPWYKRYGADFVFGTMGLSLEERGAYSICLDLIYDRGGPIPDDARWLAGVCGVSVRRWSGLRARLIEVGKLVASEGMLSNRRAVAELVSAANSSRKLAENGAKGGAKSAETRAGLNENIPLAEAGLKPMRGLPEPEPEEKKAAGVSARAPDPVGAEPVADDWPAAGAAVELARRVGSGRLDPAKTPGLITSAGAVVAWKAAGAGFERDVVPAVTGVCAKTGPPIRSWTYFDQAVLQAVAVNTRALEIPSDEQFARCPAATSADRRSAAHAEKLADVGAALAAAGRRRDQAGDV